MGDYLSVPKTNKESSDVESDLVKCGYSSMQGWRASQEDAHNCILEFDKGTSLFAVYDGHGGHEVSAYCSKQMPDFIKLTENYIKGNFEEALKDAFLGFDASLTTPEAIEVLKKIQSEGCKKKGVNPDSGGESSDSESEEDISSLVQEGHMPLEKLMAKYKVNLRLLGEGKPPVSPKLIGRRTLSSSGDAGSSSSVGPSCSSSSEQGESSDSESEEDVSSLMQEGHMPLEKLMAKYKVNLKLVGEGKPPVSPKLTGRHTPSSSGDAGSSNSGGPSCSSSSEQGDSEVSSSSSSKMLCNGFTNPTVNGDIKDKNEKYIDTEADKKAENIDNAESSFGKCEADSGNKGTEPVMSNGESQDVTSSTLPDSESLIMKRGAAIVADVYKKLLECHSDSDSSEEDETFIVDPENGEASSGSEEDNKNETANGENEQEDDDSSVDNEDEEEEEEEGEDENDTEMDYSLFNREVPGNDSGSTAVVALLVGHQLYVANAGDSRCVVGRNDGQAVEMSFDHKPEDDPERKRIEAAGGRVSMDGRVNGGLNLSRAIGDHSYKQSKELPASEQMITALPDVKTLTIDPAKDKFMVIACDGIWNSMTSQEVVDFVLTKMDQNTEPLSRICEEMFDHCLAPNTLGDGTGCDNMTCVIVQFKHPPAAKRPAEETVESCAKRSKVEADSPAS